MRILVCTLVFLLPAGAAAAAGSGGTSSPPAVQNHAGRWQFSSARASDGVRIITASLDADTPIASGFGTTIPRLVLRYHGGRTSAYVVFDTFLGDQPIDALVTFGAAKPAAERWPVSRDSRTAFVPGDPLLFMQRLKQADTFSVRVTPPHAAPVTALFTTRGAAQAIKRLFAAAMTSDGG